MIESRYSIEYVNPDEQEGSKAKRNIIIFIILGLTTLATLFYVFFSTNKITTATRTTENLQSSPEITTITEAVAPPSKLTVITEETTNTLTEKNNTDSESTLPFEATPVEIEAQKSIQEEINDLLQANEEQESKTKQQLINNKDLEASIDKLTQQLMLAIEKNKELDRQLNSKKSENSELSELLETALSKASTADKNYLSALNNLEKEKTATIANITPNIKVIADIKAPPNLISQNNNINVSTSSQVDAIIAAMQASNDLPVIKSNVDKSQELQLVSVSQTDPTDLLHIQLQREINQLLNKNNNPNTTKQTTDYKVALAKESTVRENAMRSITIKKGETLWSIAQRAYGNGVEYTKIINANPQVDLGLLFIGQVIRVPK